MEEYVYSSNRAITYRFLDIDVTDPRAINRRQPLWKRILDCFTNQRQSTGFRIRRPLLDRRPAALVAEINRYIRTHAPEGSWHRADIEGETERSGRGLARRAALDGSSALPSMLSHAAMNRRQRDVTTTFSSPCGSAVAVADSLERMRGPAYFGGYLNTYLD